MNENLVIVRAAQCFAELPTIFSIIYIRMFYIQCYPTRFESRVSDTHAYTHFSTRWEKKFAIANKGTQGLCLSHIRFNLHTYKFDVL